jgi:hypothetical protein
MLELLYLVNALVLVLALLIELRQLLLRTLPGGECPRTLLPLTLPLCAPPLPPPGDAVLANAELNVPDAPGGRPRAQVDATSAGERCRVSGVCGACTALVFVLEPTSMLLRESYGNDPLWLHGPLDCACAWGVG